MSELTEKQQTMLINGRKVYTNLGLIKQRERMAHSRQNNPEKTLRVARKYSIAFYGTIRGRYSRLKQRVKLKGICFNITIDDFTNWFLRQRMACHYCNIPLAVTSGNGYHWDSLTIDRTNNNGGYSLENIVLCCKRCNVIKGFWFNESQMRQIGRQYLWGIQSEKYKRKV